MDRKTAEIVIVALVALAVVALAAATLDSTSSPGGGGGLGGANGSGGAFLPNDSVNVSTYDVDLDPPRWAILSLTLLGIIGAIWYLWNNPLEVLELVLGMAVLFAALLMLVELLSELFGTPLGKTGGGLFSEGFSLFGGSVEDPTSTTFPVTSVELLVVIVLGVVLVWAVLWLTKEPSSREPVSGAEETSTTEDARLIGQTARTAANRIEADAPVDNEVYRAWAEMTELLDVPNPDSSTPADFAVAAVEAGMRREDVEELTALFRAVRYGSSEATPGRERRAVEAFRRIESAYLPEDPA